MYRRDHSLFPLKGAVPRDFRLRFFHESVSSKPLSIPMGPFPISLENLRRYSQLKVSTTLVANGKNLQPGKFNFVTPLGSRVNKYLIVFLQVHSKVFPLLFPLFATAYWYQQHQRYWRQNLPPVT
jgi:hypothetical protein